MTCVDCGADIKVNVDQDQTFLIAAAPDLLEWAKEALWHLDPASQQGRTIHRTDELTKGLEAAIAKAEGR